MVAGDAREERGREARGRVVEKDGERGGLREEGTICERDLTGADAELTRFCTGVEGVFRVA